MSKIGRKPITIPDGVEVKIDRLNVSAQGPKGELKSNLHTGIIVEMKDSVITVKVKALTKETRALW